MPFDGGAQISQGLGGGTDVLIELFELGFERGHAFPRGLRLLRGALKTRKQAFDVARVAGQLFLQAGNASQRRAPLRETRLQFLAQGRTLIP